MEKIDDFFKDRLEGIEITPSERAKNLFLEKIKDKKNAGIAVYPQKASEALFYFFRFRTHKPQPDFSAGPPIQYTRNGSEYSHKGQYYGGNTADPEIRRQR